MSILKDVSRVGLMYSIAIVFNRIVPPWLFRCRRFVVYRLKVQPPLESNQISVDWCDSAEDIKAAEQLTYFDSSQSPGKFRAVMAQHENENVGAFWAATECFEETELGVRLMLSPGQTWLFAAMVDKEKRGLGIYSKILQFITSELGREGFDELLVSVNPDNKPSNYIHKKHSAETIGKVFSIRVFNLAWCWSGNAFDRHSSFTSNAKSQPIEISIRPANKAAE